MRLFTLATTLLLALASAQEQQQDSYEADADTSVMLTMTLTRTVERVVETVTATRESALHATTAAPPLGTASLGAMPYGNGTSTVFGTGVGPSGGGAASTPGGPSDSGADSVRSEALGLVAVVGLVGLVGL